MALHVASTDYSYCETGPEIGDPRDRKDAGITIPAGMWHAVEDAGKATLCGLELPGQLHEFHDQDWANGMDPNRCGTCREKASTS